VYADQDRFLPGDIAHHQRHVLVGVVDAPVGNCPELAEAGWANLASVTFSIIFSLRGGRR